MTGMITPLCDSSPKVSCYPVAEEEFFPVEDKVGASVPQADYEELSDSSEEEMCAIMGKLTVSAAPPPTRAITPLNLDQLEESQKRGRDKTFEEEPCPHKISKGTPLRVSQRRNVQAKRTQLSGAQRVRKFASAKLKENRQPSLNESSAPSWTVRERLK